MFWKEDVGVISRPTYAEDKFLWTLPNCLSYRESYDQRVPVADHRYGGVTYEDQTVSELNRQCVLCSPWFSFLNENWRLVLIRHYPSDISNELVGLFLWKISSSDCEHDISIELGMIKKNNGKNSINGKLNLNGCFGEWRFEESSYFNNHYNNIYSEDGFLRVFCIFQTKENKDKFPETCENVEGEVKEKDEANIIEEIPESKGVDKLVQDLKNLFLNGQNSDVTLKVQDREFKVHRNILIVRSPVFASMLQHDTKENATGVVDIPDCSEEAFELFLSHVYTGKLDTISSANVFDLYYAADKYQVNDLKFECVEYMKTNLSIENFCGVMTLSLQHSERSLQKKATQFFCDNLKRIIKTVQWQEYIKKYPIQANELYIKAVNA